MATPTEQLLSMDVFEAAARVPTGKRLALGVVRALVALFLAVLLWDETSLKTHCGNWMARSAGLAATWLAPDKRVEVMRPDKDNPGEMKKTVLKAKLNPEDFRLDWSADAEQLRRWISTSPDECYCDVGPRRIFFLDAEVARLDSSPGSGVVTRIARTRCTVAAGANALTLGKVRLEPEGETALPRLCRALGITEGSRLA